MMEDRAESLNIKTQDRRERPNAEQPQKCPRCDSLNTKFCYYNNYGPSQPRYFCKDCRRYWTKGGTLRNVPVGGGCRKGSKRPKRFGSDNIMMNNPSIHQDGQASIFPILSPFSGIRPHFFFNQSSAGPKNITDVKASAGTPSVSSLVMQPQFADGLTLGGYKNIFSSSSSTLPHPHHELHPTSLPHAEYLSPKIERWETGDGCMTTTIFQPSGTGKQAVVSTRMPCPMKSEPQVGVEGSASASPIGVCYWNGTSSNSEQWPAGLSGYAPSNSYS